MSSVDRPDNRPQTLVDLLSTRALDDPDQIVYRFLVDGEIDGPCLSVATLDREARSIARQLQQRVAVGDRALLLFPTGLEYIAAFFGCLYAGVVAVPAYPPRPNRSLARVQAMIRSAQPAILLTTTAIRAVLDPRLDQLPGLAGLPWLTPTDGDPDESRIWQRPQVTSETLALLQYTSGSTGTPRGVMITHRQLLQNLSAIRDALGVTPATRAVCWLPPYHDMGLIGGILEPLVNVQNMGG